MLNSNALPGMTNPTQRQWARLFPRLEPVTARVALWPAHSVRWHAVCSTFTGSRDQTFVAVPSRGKVWRKLSCKLRQKRAPYPTGIFAAKAFGIEGSASFTIHSCSALATGLVDCATKRL